MRLQLVKAFLLLILFTNTSFAQNFQYQNRYKDIVCADAQTIIKVLGEIYNENPIWVNILPDVNGSYIMMHNKIKRSWTLLQLDKDQACLIAVGSNLESLEPQKQD